MANKKVIETVEPIENETVEVIDSPKWKLKVCRVINYIPSHGILGFDFDGIGCQISVKKNLNIGHTIEVQYMGEIGKDIKFKI